MKGDFSWFDYRPSDNFTGVLEQQGRVRIDRDGLAAEEIGRNLRNLMGRDAFGPGRVAVPAEASGSFRIAGASTDGTDVEVTYAPGRAWIEGIPLISGREITGTATYLPPPLQEPVGPDSIDADVRDAVVLEVWEDSVSAFQDLSLLEPALGGVDTTARVRVCHRLRLRRLGPDEDCRTIDLRDDPATLGRLTVTPAPAIAIAGDCPVEAGGGYAGAEHRLYCVEITQPRDGNERFLWSRHGGGLVGRGRYDAVEQTIEITHNLPMIRAAGVTGMTLQALSEVAGTGCWEVVFEATVSLDSDGVLNVTDAVGTWPAGPGEHGFFRLWDGVAPVGEFIGANEVDDGILLDFTPPAEGAFRPGDRWQFQARADGEGFDPSVWPTDAPPQGVRYHRAPLGILTWTGPAPQELGPDDISDCRDSFPPLTDPCPCCTITVGDGRRTHADEDSIEAAIERLPSSGGRICLLPGLHETNAVLHERANITIKGCGRDTRVVPRPGQRDEPVFHVSDCENIRLTGMEIITLSGVGIFGESSDDDALRQIYIAGNRIIACVRAVQFEGGSDIAIRENRIRMIDRNGSGVAVYLAASDSRIEDNDIGVVPAEVTPRPPDDGEDDDEPEDPNDPCADEETIYANIGFLIGFVEFLFGFTLTAYLPPPYRALGGVQLGAGTVRTWVLDNRILGGAGNGITLGGSHIVEGGDGGGNGPVFQDVALVRTDLVVEGEAIDPDGNPASGTTFQIRSPSGQVRSFEVSASGGFTIRLFEEEGTHRISPVTTGIGIETAEILGRITTGRGSLVRMRLGLNRQREEADPRLGFLYGIRIEDNVISEMGLNGIGIPPAPGVLGISAEVQPDSPTLRRVRADEPRFSVARAAAVNPALERLGHPVNDLTIRNNRIVRNLGRPFSTAMLDAARVSGFGGISLGLCETVTVAGNRIESNGRRHVDPVCGIFILFGEQVEITDNLIRDNGPFERTEAEIRTGLRSGIAGIFLSIGLDDFGADDNRGSLTVKPALRVHDNVVQQPMGRAMTVMAAGPVSVIANHLTAERTGAEAADRMAGALMLISLSGVGNLPSGGCLVNSNQISLGAESEAMIAVALAAAEDLGLDANQIHALHGGLVSGDRSFMLNTLVFAGSTRATGNRFREPFRSTETAFQLSLLSLTTLMNTATSNQGDHCIYAFDLGSPPKLMSGGNMVFDTTFCDQLQSAAAGAARNPILGTAGLKDLGFINDLDEPEGAGRVYGQALDANLVTLNTYQQARLTEAVEYKTANAALLDNEIARLETGGGARADIVAANRARLATIRRDVTRIRAAQEIVADKPEIVEEETDDNNRRLVVLQGRVTTLRGVGIALAEVALGDARGRPVTALQPGTTDRNGKYAMRFSMDEIERSGADFDRGATIIATPPTRGAESVASRVFELGRASLLVPDIRIQSDSDRLPEERERDPLRPTRPDVRRPTLVPGRRLTATSGRIKPLLRAMKADVDREE
ncbi:DUF6519 domain-containing protein [Amaricoccus tamworthensis]|uniref:DUF6519 domain-containing protein n=1 Tax=Amaricoccus tamworthensis TaxID=57002 RepID=UPI003C7C7CE7